MNTNPALEGLVADARAVTCEEYAERAGWPLKRQSAYLTGPCPKCGGDDRFSIQTVENKWNCRNCGIGGYDAISLVQHLDARFENMAVKDAFIKVCEVVTGRSAQEAMSREEADRRKAELEAKRRKNEKIAEQKRAEARAAAHRLWKAARPAGHVIAEYLEARKINIEPEQLRMAVRQATALSYYHDGKKRHEGPAMICAIQWANGYFGGVHRTWTDPARPKGKALILSADGKEALDSKKTLGSLGDGAIRLFTPPDARRLVLGEGNETTLTPMAYAFQEQTAYWSGINIGHMAGRAARDERGKIVADQPDMADEKCFRVPDWCEELILLGEDQGSDEKKAAKTRQALARAARRHLRRRPDLIVKIAWPGSDGDFNDLVLGHSEAEQ